MRQKLRWSAAVLLLLLAAAAGMLAAALQPQAAVTQPLEVGPQDLMRAAALLRAHGPRRTPPERRGTLMLGERDLEVLLNQGLRRWPQAAGRVRLEDGAATLMLSFSAAPNPFGRWINVQARWRHGGDLPALQSLQVGHLRLPGWLGTWAAQRWAQNAGLNGELQLAADVVQRVRFSPSALRLSYVWRQDSARRMLDLLLPPGEQERLHAYAERLSGLSAELKPAWTATLAQLMGPIFELARQRSAAAGGDAAAENRAAIVVLALYANGRGVESVLPVAPDWPRPRPLRLLLAGRDDFPRHFLGSAALVVEGAGALARSIGLAKEVSDARTGSGFSFNDMAANLAGSRFGEMALRSPAELQARMAAGVSDDDLMPAWTDLPQFMPEAEFVSRFGGVGAPAYEAMMAEIASRVSALSLFR